MTDPSNICLSCGLCCNGTLIGFVHLDGDELSSVSEFMEIVKEGNQGFFLQPCDKLGPGGCSIYSNRPKQCSKFNCGLLNAVEQKEIDFNAAVDVIKRVRQLKRTIEKTLLNLTFNLKSKSFYFQTLELKKLLRKMENQSPLSHHHQKLNAELCQLDEILLNKFGLS